MVGRKLYHYRSISHSLISLLATCVERSHPLLLTSRCWGVCRVHTLAVLKDIRASHTPPWQTACSNTLLYTWPSQTANRWRALLIKKHISTQTHTFTVFLKYRVLEVQVFSFASYRHPGQKGQNVIVCLQTNIKTIFWGIFVQSKVMKLIRQCHDSANLIQDGWSLSSLSLSKEHQASDDVTQHDVQVPEKLGKQAGHLRISILREKNLLLRMVCVCMYVWDALTVTGMCVFEMVF